MKEIFFTCEMEVLQFFQVDVIQTSGGAVTAAFEGEKDNLNE